MASEHRAGDPGEKQYLEFKKRFNEKWYALATYDVADHVRRRA